MWKTPARMALVLAILPASAPAQDTRQVLDEVSKVMGTSGLNAITWSGVAAEGNFGQSRTISFGLASTSIANYTVTIDFARAAARMTGVTTPPPVRGAAPPPRGTLDRAISPDAPWSEQFQIWVTPWGFLRGAAAQGATLKNQKIDGVPYTVVTWVPAQRAPSGQAYRVVGYINADKLVERVETWVDHPIFGDMHVETRYRDYRNAGGLLVPARVTQRCVGMETFVAAINTVRVNPPDLGQLLPPAAIAAPSSAPAAPVGARSEKLADGVYRITGSYAALAVEFQDHAVVLEGGESEARGLAIIAETKRLFPGKRIKYVVNTHPHFDHAAGLPPFVADGAVVLTDDPNRYFLEQALRSPRTLVGDSLARSRKRATVQGVVDKMVLADRTRTLELHHVPQLDHSDGMLVAYLPKERILFTADIELPDSGDTPGPSLVTLATMLGEVPLEFERYLTVHGTDRVMTRSDLRLFAARKQ